MMVYQLKIIYVCFYLDACVYRVYKTDIFMLHIYEYLLKHKINVVIDTLNTMQSLINKDICACIHDITYDVSTVFQNHLYTYMTIDQLSNILPNLPC